MSSGRRAPRAVTADVLEPRVFADGASGEPSDFHRRVAAVVRLVPAGRVTTYGDVGTILGSPRVARQVGWALAALPEGSDVPWHRVVNAQGAVSGRGELARAALQMALLRDEGVVFDERGRLDLSARRWGYPGVSVPFRLGAEPGALEAEVTAMAATPASARGRGPRGRRGP